MIIGVTGPIGSGKKLVVKFLSKKLGYKIVRLSDFVEKEIRRKGLELSRENFQRIGNLLRKKYHNGILAEFALKELNKDGIIDGIRNPGEIEYLREKLGKNFILIAVDVNKDWNRSRTERFKRILKRKRKGDPKTWSEFIKIDDIELGFNSPKYGLRILDCMKMADIFILNDSTIEDLKKKVDKIVDRLKSNCKSTSGI